MEIQPTDPVRRRYWQWINEEIDLAKSRCDTAYLSAWKREIARNYPLGSERPRFVDQVLFRLDGVPDVVRCDCCGAELTKHSFQKSGPSGILLTLGRECVHHELGACRQ
ncbi:MAG: hypothetical protein JRN68_06610 [Nitrososphaerota archaeon]|nr:hypothetical protein [Nitrososphaerota archaeon]